MNPYGCQMGPCNFCGFCSDYGCLNYSKACPTSAFLPALRLRKEFELRTNAQVLRSISTAPAAPPALPILTRRGERRSSPRLVVAVRVLAVQRAPHAAFGHRQAIRPGRARAPSGRNYSYQNLNRVTLFFGERSMPTASSASAAAAPLSTISTAISWTTLRRDLSAED